LDFGADCTADTEMRVPESHVARFCSGNVDLDLSTVSGSFKRSEDDLPFCNPEEHRPP
jgi:transcription elongation factor